MNAVLAIDIGTSSAKLSLFDANGGLLISRGAAYAVEMPHAGWAEQDADLWWRAVVELAPQVMARLRGNRLAAICVSGQAPLCTPVDDEGRPLRKAILWLDRRSAPEVDWMARNLGEERCIAVGINRLDSYFGASKWLWYRQTEPGLFGRTWKIMQANGFVTWKLTGQVAIDPTQAGLCSPAFGFAAGAWSESICHDLGLPVEMLPDIRPSASVIGEVHEEAARTTGLPEGTPVVCGAGDFACACLGAGATGTDTAALMLGTAGNLLLPGVSSTDTRLIHTYDVTGQPLTFGSVLAGGNVSWLAGLFGGSNRGYDERAAEAAAHIAPGSEGLVYLPYLMGERSPIWDPDARGAFIGLTARHGRAHLYRAVLEGVAFAFRQIWEIAAPQDVDAIVAIDGGARSEVWRSILASVIGVPIRSGSDRAGTGIGAAYLAAVGARTAVGFGGIHRWVEHGDEVRPDPDAQRRYGRLYQVYAGLYPKLRADFDRLSD